VESKAAFLLQVIFVPFANGMPSGKPQMSCPFF